MAILGIFLATSKLFKRSKNSFYLSIGILNQVKHIRYNKRSRLTSFYISVYQSLLLKVKAVLISLFTRNRFYWVLEYPATAYISLALDLAVRLIIYNSVEIKSLVSLGECRGGAIDFINSVNPINYINYINPIDC